MTSFLGQGGYNPSGIPGGSVGGASPFASGGGNSSTPGFGLSALGGVMDIFGGLSANQSYNTEAGAVKAQANEAIREASMEANQKAMEVQRFAGDQQEEYNSSGVTGAGTPAQVIAQTRNLGQQEVNAIARRGAFQAQMMRTQANQLQTAGRNSILGGLFKAGMAVAPFL